jgi:hypothetical protein
MKRAVACAVLLACGSGSESPTPTPSPPKTLPKAPEPAAPAIVRHTGDTKATEVPTQGTVTGKATDKHGAYLAITVAGETPVPLHTEWIHVASNSGHAFAVPAAPNRILVHFANPSALPPERVELSWIVPDQDDWSGLRGGQRHTLVVEKAQGAPFDADLARSFHRAGAEWFAEHGRARNWSSLPFYAYASARFTYLADKLEPKGTTPPRRAPRTDLHELMDLYTGMTSVDEAMQTDRALLLPDDAGVANLPASAIKPLDLPAHPWDKLLAALPGKPQPVVEPLAKSVPDDFLYLHAHDLRRLVLMARALDERFAPIAAVIEQRGSSAEMVARLERELAVERTGLAETLGHLAAGGVALVASDPFFREGNDVSLLFLVKNETLLMRALDEFATRSKGTWSEVTLAGKPVALLTTPDGSVRRYQLRLGDVLVLSNSPGAVTRLIEVAAGKRPNLAASGDFRYFRALYPAKASDEDVFVFASDAFIAQAVSPRVKVLESRRLRARAELMAVNHAALLHGWIEGRRAVDANDLTRSQLGVVPPGVTFTAERGAASKMGTARRATPLLDLELGKVTAAERDAYARFRETYQTYWRGFIDPIGARLEIGEDGSIAFDARMMPLISGTEYDDIRRQVGDRRVGPPVAKGGAHFVLAVGDDAGLRREVDRLAHSIGPDDFGIGWLGDWVALGAADREGIWELALLSRELPELHPPAREGLGSRRQQERRLWPRLPFYAMAHVKSKVGLIATLTVLRKYIDSAAPGQLEWGPAGKYRGIDVVEVGAKPSSELIDDFGDVKLRYAIVGDVLVLALERQTFEHAVDMVLDKRVARESSDATAMQTAVTVDAAAGGPLHRTTLAFLEAVARDDARAAARQWEAITRGKVALEQAAWFLGETPGAAAGGAFTLDAAGAVEHSLYGSDGIPKLPAALPADSPLAKALVRLAGFDLGLAFEGKGDAQGLRTTGRLR